MAVAAWQRETHLLGLYDLEVDTSVMNPEECAEAIGRRLKGGVTGATAFEQLATRAL